MRLASVVTNGEEMYPAAQGQIVNNRDPRIDPQAGDILRCNCEGFDRKILKREANRVLVQIGMNSRGS